METSVNERSSTSSSSSSIYCDVISDSAGAACVCV